MRKHLYLVSILLGMGVLSGIDAHAQQKIGNNPGTLNPGAILELESTNRGFLLPRVSLPTTLTTFGLNGQPTVESNGMMVYNTNASTPGGVGYYVWSGTTAPNTGGAWSRIFTGTIAATTNAFSYNAGTLTSTVNGVGASATLPTANTSTLGLLSAADWTTFNGKQNALTVSNGLTLTGSALRLGGDLTAATTIGQLGFAMNFTGTGGLNLNSGNVTINGTGGYAPLVVRNANGANTDAANGNKVVSVLANSPSGDPNFILTTMTGLTSNADGSRVFSLGGNYLTSNVPASAMWAGINFYRGTGTTTNGGLGIATGGSDRISVGSDGIVAINGTANSLTSQLRLPNFVSTNTSIAGLSGSADQLVLGVDASGTVVLRRDFGTANAGTVTNITGTAPITVTNGSTTPVIGINQSALDLASIGGTLPITKLVPGSTGQTLQMVGTTPTWVTPSAANTQNIYTANGTLTGNRSISMGATAGSQFTMAFDTTTLFINPTLNRVGVGTSTPITTFHVTGSSNPVSSNGVGQINVGSTGQAGKISFSRASDGGANASIGYNGIGETSEFAMGAFGGAAFLSFYAGPVGAERARIANNGFMGIGTKDPSARLHVNGTLRFDSTGVIPAVGHVLRAVNTNGTAQWGTISAASIEDGSITAAKLNPTGTTAGQVLTSTGASTAPTWQTLPTATNIYNANGTLGGNRVVDQVNNNLQFINSSNGTGKTMFGNFGNATAANNTATVGFAGRLAAITDRNSRPAFSVMNDSISTVGNRAEIAFRTQGSNPVLGNSASITAIQRSATSAETDLTFGTFSGTGATSERMRITGNGNVGIGTATPLDPLHIARGSGVGVRIANHLDATIGYAQLRTSTNAETGGGGGSGTLELRGAANTDGVKLIGGANSFIGVNGGNFGIGTTSPSQKLHVNGTLRFENNGNTPVVGSVLRAVNTDGTAQWGTIDAAGLGTGSVTYAKIQNVAASRLLGNPTGNAAAPSEISVSNGLSMPTTGTALELGGALTKATSIGLGTNNLTLDASGTGQVIVSGPAGNTAGLRLSNLTGAGTAGTSGQKVLSVNASGDVVLVTDFGTANAGTVTNVTGTAPITVTNGTTAPVIGINQAALDLASIGGTLPVTKLAAGTTGQTLQMVGTTPTWVTPTTTNSQNIYTANGSLTGSREVTIGNFDLRYTINSTNTLTFARGHGTGSDNMRFMGSDTLEFQIAGTPNILTMVGGSGTHPNGAVFIGSNGAGPGDRARPTSTLTVNGSVSRKVDGIVQSAVNIAAASRTLNATHHVVTIDAETAPASPNNFIEVILPNPSTCSGREYVIRKIDNTSNEIRFSYPVNGANPAVAAGGNAILVSKGSFTGVLNYVRTMRIISNGTNWLLID